MQKDGTTNPPGGITTVCLQVASAAPVSRIVTTPGGNGNGAKPPTLSVPPLPDVIVTRSAAQQPPPGGCNAAAMPFTHEVMSAWLSPAAQPPAFVSDAEVLADVFARQAASVPGLV